MATRPVIPKDLSKFPDFPKQHELNQEDYEKLIISYWASKRRNKRKIAQEHFQMEKKSINLLEKTKKAALQLVEFRKVHGLQPTKQSHGLTNLTQ